MQRRSLLIALALVAGPFLSAPLIATPALAAQASRMWNWSA